MVHFSRQSEVCTRPQLLQCILQINYYGTWNKPLAWSNQDVSSIFGASIRAAER